VDWLPFAILAVIAVLVCAGVGYVVRGVRLRKRGKRSSDVSRIATGSGLIAYGLLVVSLGGRGRAGGGSGIVAGSMDPVRGIVHLHGNMRPHVCRCRRGPQTRRSSGREEMTLSNNAFERTGGHCGRAALALDCVLAGLEWAPCQAAQRNR
jgi:hypothetical protein